MKISRKSTDVLKDCLLIILITLLSSVLNIRKIGFYSDDWSFLSTLSLTTDHSVIGLFKAATNPNTFMRPVQNLLDASLFSMFGLNPLGYQVSSLIFLIVSAVLFYILLKKLGMPRIVCLAIPLVFVLLPNYSTDRFWFAAFQANLSILLYFASSIAALHAISCVNIRAKFWIVLSILLLFLSTLAYEVILPFYFLNALVLSYLISGKDLRRLLRIKHKVKEKILIGLTILSTFSVFIFKAKATVRLQNSPLQHFELYPVYLGYVIFSSMYSNYVQMLQSLIYIWSSVTLRDIHSGIIEIVLLVGICIFVYLFRIMNEDNLHELTLVLFRKLTLLGIFCFILGYSIFFFNNNVGFSPTGMDNRVAIGATLGVVMSIVGGFGWLCRRLFSDKLFRLLFSFGIALLCMSGCLAINRTASYWSESYIKQKVILTRIQSKFSTLKTGSTFILDGVCPYEGPVVVFDANWDLSGALQLLYRDTTIRADIVTPRTQVTRNAITTTFYGTITSYPYKDLVIYNYNSNKAYQVHQYEDAVTYFRTKKYGFDNHCSALESEQSNKSMAIKNQLLLLIQYIKQTLKAKTYLRLVPYIQQILNHFIS